MQRRLTSADPLFRPEVGRSRGGDRSGDRTVAACRFFRPAQACDAGTVSNGFEGSERGDGFHQSFAHIPRCIASSSSMDRLQLCLSVLALEAEFGSHVFSADMVARGKPHPDIFLFAASKLGVRPDECLVIEDSAGGIRAAVAAGMTVVGLCAASHIREGHDLKLREPAPCIWRNRGPTSKASPCTFSIARTHAPRRYHAGMNGAGCRGMVHHPIHSVWGRVS